MILYNAVQNLLVVTAEDITHRTHITQCTPCVFSILCVSFLVPCSVHKLCYADCAESFLKIHTNLGLRSSLSAVFDIIVQCSCIVSNTTLLVALLADWAAPPSCPPTFPPSIHSVCFNTNFYNVLSYGGLWYIFWYTFNTNFPSKLTQFALTPSRQNMDQNQKQIYSV